MVVPAELDPAGAAGVTDVLEQARQLGFLGPGPVADHIDHALGFAAALGRIPAGPLLDLGSGGGLPGLVLALAWPESSWTLLDAGARRTAFLSASVQRLQLADRVQVVTGRAEVVGRSPAHRGRYQLVAARSFARPAVVAECAAPLLVPGGSLLVSDPPAAAPHTPPRWPAAALAALGLHHVDGPLLEPRVIQLEQVAICPDRYPRRTGVPDKRPLW
ncbi:MAG TPA: RsmG family class I SAM-dependent methyltransferase [Acidimicrobiales bacterium]|jgi:16S rRNA (guanine527-N7)-methyltransferase|nr:RsmG family class I SAM-dependent methyltransferase [Acidimicrobiales bacterium]